MKTIKNFKPLLIITAVLCSLLYSLAGLVAPASATQFSLSPMYQFVSLTPGETYTGNFQIINPDFNQYDFHYKLRITPFSVDDTDDIHLTANGDYNRIIDWIELSEESGAIAPNEVREVRFKINVPEDAPAGGQYASIVVSSGEYRVDNNTVDLREVYEAAHLIYADVAGETVRKGTVDNLNVPSFLFSGNITGSAQVTNEGNVHSKATQTLQIFPLFSGEEIYTNEEDPKATWILPGNSLITSVAWEKTPSTGSRRGCPVPGRPCRRPVGRPGR